MTADDRRGLTYRYERLRAPASGVLEAAGMTFLLLIAVRHFQSGAVGKAIIGAGTSLGLLLGPWVVSRVQAAQRPAAGAASLLALIGMGLFTLAALLPSQWVFVGASALGLACASSMIPLMTQVYHENYPRRERGTLFSRTVMIRIAATGVFSYLAGRALSFELDEFRWLLLVFAAAFAYAAGCLRQCPSRPLTHAAGTHPFRSLRFVRQDQLFRQLLISWMFMGFGNLMMLPLRVEYLANPEHGWTLNGLPLTTAMIAVLIGVVPNAARLVVHPLWGWLFDRTDFLVLRIALNMGFLVGILTFFMSGSLPGLVLGAVLYGISQAGGDVAWGLWVTKFAPPGRVADYMSVHTFFTGVRGVIAPMVAFQWATVLPVSRLAWVSASSILVATFILIPLLREGTGRQDAVALTEEISE